MSNGGARSTLAGGSDSESERDRDPKEWVPVSFESEITTVWVMDNDSLRLTDRERLFVGESANVNVSDGRMVFEKDNVSVAAWVAVLVGRTDVVEVNDSVGCKVCVNEIRALSVERVSVFARGIVTVNDNDGVTFRVHVKFPLVYRSLKQPGRKGSFGPSPPLFPATKSHSGGDALLLSPLVVPASVRDIWMKLSSFRSERLH